MVMKQDVPKKPASNPRIVNTAARAPKERCAKGVRMELMMGKVSRMPLHCSPTTPASSVRMRTLRPPQNIWTGSLHGGWTRRMSAVPGMSGRSRRQAAGTAMLRQTAMGSPQETRESRKAQRRKASMARAREPAQPKRRALWA